MTFEITLTDFPRGKIPRTTAQQKRYNSRTGCFFGSEALNAARYYYESRLCIQRRGHGVKDPFCGPVKLFVRFNFKAARKKDIGKPKTTRPDCDNAVKLIQDCLMSAGWISDDSQIYQLTVAKYWSDSESVYINLETEEGENGI